MPWPKGKPRGNAVGPGRPRGSKNKRTLQAEAVAKAIVEDAQVQARWLAQARAGELPAPVLQTLMHYAWGRPVQRIEASGPEGALLQVRVQTTLREALARGYALREADGHAAPDAR